MSMGKSAQRYATRLLENQATVLAGFGVIATRICCDPNRRQREVTGSQRGVARQYFRVSRTIVEHGRDQPDRNARAFEHGFTTHHGLIANDHVLSFHRVRLRATAGFRPPRAR